MSTKKENRGGAREGSGPKKKIKKYSEAVKRRYELAAKKIEKETGQSIEEHYLRMSIDPDVQPAARAAFAKLYNEALLVKESEHTLNDNRQGPVIGLPPVQERPKHIEAEEKSEEHRLHG